MKKNGVLRICFHYFLTVFVLNWSALQVCTGQTQCGVTSGNVNVEIWLTAHHCFFFVLGLLFQFVVIIFFRVNGVVDIE